MTAIIITAVICGTFLVAWVAFLLAVTMNDRPRAPRAERANRWRRPPSVQ